MPRIATYVPDTLTERESVNLCNHCKSQIGYMEYSLLAEVPSYLLSACVVCDVTNADILQAPPQGPDKCIQARLLRVDQPGARGRAALHVVLTSNGDEQRCSWLAQMVRGGSVALPVVLLTPVLGQPQVHALYIIRHYDGALCLTHCTCGWEHDVEGFAPGEWFKHAHPGVAP